VVEVRKGRTHVAGPQAGLRAAETSDASFAVQARVCSVKRERPGPDDEEERRVRLLLLGKAAVLAHRDERPLAAEMDE
jgi:hypothetical protein